MSVDNVDAEELRRIADANLRTLDQQSNNGQRPCSNNGHLLTTAIF